MFLSSNKKTAALLSDDKASLTTAEEWFSLGRRVCYDPTKKRIVDQKTKHTIEVFERVVPAGGKAGGTTKSQQQQEHDTRRWLTMLPGFPDGSFGYAKVEKLLQQKQTADSNATSPRLYVEYIGQGDSDKPSDYTYSTKERADLVEAQWKAHGIHRTVVVTFDYSSIVLLELLQRQREGRCPDVARIEHVLMINGGLFADGHSHPFTTTPLLKTRVLGRMGSSMAQRSNFVLDTMLKPLYGKEYRRSTLTTRELRETEKAIRRRHNGAAFLSNAAGFVDEHKQNAKRWDLYDIYVNHCEPQGITVHIVGSVEDPFEHKQIGLARDRLLMGGKEHYAPAVHIETIPGGHLSTAEQAPALVQRIETLVRKGGTTTSSRAQPSWTAM